MINKASLFKNYEHLIWKSKLSIWDLVSASKPLDNFLNSILETSLASSVNSEFHPQGFITKPILRNLAHVNQILVKFDMRYVCITLVDRFDFCTCSLITKDYLTYGVYFFLLPKAHLIYAINTWHLFVLTNIAARNISNWRRLSANQFLLKTAIHSKYCNFDSDFYQQQQ
jgi:hypothetical protein